MSWRLDLSSTKLCVKSVELKVTSKVYENGKVIWQLCGGKQCLLPTPGVTLKTEQMAGSKEVKVGASLQGGKGDIAWQHTQLFRTEMGDPNCLRSEPQLSLIVTLRKDNTGGKEARGAEKETRQSRDPGAEKETSTRSYHQQEGHPSEVGGS